MRLTGVDWSLLAPQLYYQGADLAVHEPAPGAGLLYRLRRGASEEISGRRITVNSLGFRGRERTAAKPAGAFRIVCLGSSNTYGALVQDGETYPARLEELLDADGRARFEVWNAGVSAYTLAQSAAWAEEIAASDAPDLFVIQLHSTRRRPFLLNRPFARYFAEDPSLFVENLRWLPFGASPAGLAPLRRSALVRALVFAVNRSARVAGNNPAYEKGDLGEGALRRLRALGVPLAILRNPGGGIALPGESGLPVLDLGARLPKGYSADHLLIHPPAYVYRWYSAELASFLRAGKLIPR